MLIEAVSDRALDQKGSAAAEIMTTEIIAKPRRLRLLSESFIVYSFEKPEAAGVRKEPVNNL
jgi:hypothetical protein